MDRPLRLLSLDGGGIRGYSELLILEAIMHRVQGLLDLPAAPPPADYFDLIGGTSAGGLIAIMLGRLHMTVEEAKETFCALSAEMFRQKNVLWMLRDEKYSDQVFTSIIQDVIQRKLNDKDARLRCHEQACKIFVCCVCKKGAIPQVRLFRSYEAVWNHEHDCAIWEAARATAAAPTYYSPMKIGPPGHEESFIDGGLGCNNPIRQLHYEAERLFDPNREVGCIISLGTGKRKVNEMLDSHKIGASLFPIEVIKSLKRLALDSEIEAVKMDIKYRGTDGLYYRFNVEHGLEDVKLYEFERLDLVETQTRAYLELADIQIQLDRAAVILTGQVKFRQRPYALGYLSSSVERVISATLHQLSKQQAVQDIQKSFQKLFSSVRTHCSALDDYNNNLLNRFIDEKNGSSTCSWIFKEKQFLDTHRAEKTSVLWLKGRPGSGKTVLASVIIEKLKQRYTTLYFFCHQNSQPANPKNILCGLLEQISQWEYDRVERRIRRFRDKYPNLADLGEDVTAELFELCKSLLIATTGRVFIVVDAIDNCDANTHPTYSLVTGLRQAGLEGRLSFIFTSRKGMENALRGIDYLLSNELEITQERTAQDLRAFMDYRIADINTKLAARNAAAINETVETIYGRSNGMFLYASLILDDLELQALSSLEPS